MFFVLLWFKEAALRKERRIFNWRLLEYDCIRIKRLRDVSFVFEEQRA